MFLEITNSFHFLGVNTKALIDALTSKTLFAHGETVVSTLNTHQVRSNSNNFLPTLFIYLFGGIDIENDWTPFKEYLELYISI